MASIKLHRQLMFHVLLGICVFMLLGRVADAFGLQSSAGDGDAAIAGQRGRELQSNSTVTPSATPTVSDTPSGTPSTTQTASGTPTQTPTGTPSQTPSETPEPSSTPSSTPTPSQTRTPSTTTTPTASQTGTPSGTPSTSPTPSTTASLPGTPSGTPTATRTATQTPTASLTPSSTPRASLGPLSIASTRDELWSRGVIKNLWGTCAFQTYFKYRWRAPLDPVKSDWSNNLRSAVYTRYVSTFDFDSRSWYLHISGIDAQLSKGDGSVPALCAVANPDTRVGSWVYIGNGRDSADCASNGGDGAPNCGCWACVPPALGPYRMPVFTVDVPEASQAVDASDTVFYGRWAKSAGTLGGRTPEALRGVLYDYLPSGGAAVPVPMTLSVDVNRLGFSSNNTGIMSATSSSVFGMLMSRGSDGRVMARCTPGNTWYKLGQLAGDMDPSLAARTLFCAPSTAASDYAQGSYYARLQNTSQVREGNGVGKPIIRVQNQDQTYSNLAVWWADKDDCTKCRTGESLDVPCTYAADAQCSTCACGVDEHLVKPCDGKAAFQGCIKCMDTVNQGDSLGNMWTSSRFIPYNNVTRQRPRNSVQCAPGTFNSLSEADTYHATCELNGWTNNGLYCKLCDPIRAPFANVPSPAVGSPVFQYSCSPGYEQVGGSANTTCPVQDNKSGNNWVGGLIQCRCTGISDTHACAFEDSTGDDRWLLGQEDGTAATWLRQKYTSNSNWIADVASPDWRGELLAGVRFYFNVKLPSGRLLTYQFSQMDDKASAAAGIIRFNNSAQYLSQDNALRGLPYEHAMAIVKVTYKDAGVRKPVQLRVPGSDNALEFWFGAESSIKAKAPTASGYFGMKSYTDAFTLDARIQVIGSTDTNNLQWNGIGLLERHYAREMDAGVQPGQGGISQYYSKRVQAGVEMSWVDRHCPAGQYQVGDMCMTCSDGTYSTALYKARKYSADGSKLLPINGTAAIGAMCLACQCASCMSCGPDSASCVPYNSSCTIGGKCVKDGALNPVSQCQWCDADVSLTSYTNIPRGRPCDDGDMCTFFDRCDGLGGCTGSAGKCLMSSVDPAYNCEVCGQDRCDRRVGFTGCTYVYTAQERAVTGKDKICGCSIDGACYPHGTLHPNNTCLTCDVSQDAAGWTSTTMKTCDDGNLCTFGDVCLAGQCVGSKLDCSPQGRCVRSSVCDGTEKCQVTYWGSDVKCTASSGACSADAFCTGDVAYCPPPLTVVPVISVADVLPAAPVNPYGSLALSTDALAALGFISQLASTSSVADPVLGYPSTQLFAVSAMNWTAPCAGLQFRLGLFTGDMNSPCTSTSVTDAKAGGLGYTDWVDGPTMQAAGLTMPALDGVTLDSRIVLSDGAYLRARVESRSTMDGYTAAVTSKCAQFVVDSSAPAPGWIRNVDLAKLLDDGTNVDAVSRRQLGFTWGGFVEDSFSSTWGSLLQYRFAVGTTPGATNVVPWRWVGFAQSAATRLYADVLPLYTPLYVTLQGFNRAGLSASVTASGVYIDDTGPVMQPGGFVYDGIKVDAKGKPVQQWAINREQVDAGAGLSVQWGGITETDPGSSLDHYEVAFGFSPGSQQLQAFSVVPGGAAANAATASFGQWTVGSRYIATVRAVSRSGAYTDFYSKGMWFDDSAPYDVKLFPPTQAGYGECGPVRLRYTYSEEQSMIGSVDVWVGTSPDAEDVLVRTTITGNDLATGFLLPALKNSNGGRQVYVSVQLTNVAGYTSTTPATTSFVQDCTGPTSTGQVVPTAPSDRLGAAVSFHTGPSITAKWAPCEDTLSGIVSYEVQVMVQPSAARSSSASGPVLADFRLDNTTDALEALGWVPMGQGLAADLSSYLPAPAQGTTHYINLRCSNGAGTALVRSSQGVVVDSSAPVATVARVYKPGTSPVHHDSTSTVLVSIDASDPQSGIASLRIALTLEGSPLPGNVVPFTPISVNAKNYTFTGLSLAQSLTYLVHLEATNRAGSVTLASSLSFFVDSTGPELGMDGVLDGLGSDLDFTTELKNLTFSWPNACSDSGSGIFAYRLCAGTAPGLCDLLPQRTLPGSVTTFTGPFVPPSNSLCAPSPARLLLDDHPAPSHLVGSGAWLHEDDASTIMDADTVLGHEGVHVAAHGRALVSDDAVALTRMLHESSDARQLQQQYSTNAFVGPDWLMRLRGRATNGLQLGDWSYTITFGDKIYGRQVANCPCTAYVLFWCSQTTCGQGDNAYHRETAVVSVTDGLADMGTNPRVLFRGNQGYGGLPYNDNYIRLLCDPGRNDPYVAAWRNLGSAAEWDVYTREVCGFNRYYRVGPATQYGPPAVMSTNNTCIASVLLDGPVATTSTVYRVCPFGQVTSYPFTSPSSVTSWGYFDRWDSDRVDGRDVYKAAFFDGGSACGNQNGLKKSSVQYVCAASGVPSILSASTELSPSDQCLLRMVVALPSACGALNMTLPAVLAPTPSASGAPLPDRYRPRNATGQAAATALPSAVVAVPVRSGARPYYGPQGLSTVVGTCVEAQLTSADVSSLDAPGRLRVCPFSNVTYIPSVGPVVSLGFWDNWALRRVAGSTSYDRLVYSGGQCGSMGWTVMVTPLCSTDGSSRVVSASQTGPCSLAASIAIPAMCPFSYCSPGTYTGRVFAQLDCINGAGLSLPNGPISSDGVMVDPSPPNVGQVRYGPIVGGTLATSAIGAPQPGPFFFTRVPFRLTMANFTTALAPVRDFRVSVGTKPGASDVLAPVRTGGATWLDVPIPKPLDGQQYYATVSASTAAGVAVMVSADVPAVFDSSPPVTHTAGVSLPTPSSFLNSSYSTEWMSATELAVCALIQEPHSAISSMTVQLGTATGSSQFEDVTIPASQLNVLPPLRGFVVPQVQMNVTTPSCRASSSTASAVCLVDNVSTNQRGSASSVMRVPVDRPFTATVTFSITQNSSTFTLSGTIGLVLHNDPRAAAAGTASTGACFGMMGVNPTAPAVAVAVQASRVGTWQRNHIVAVNSSNPIWSTASCPSISTYGNLFNASDLTVFVADGDVYDLSLTYDPAARTLSYGVWKDADPVARSPTYVMANVDLQAALRADRFAYLAIGAGTAADRAIIRVFQTTVEGGTGLVAVTPSVNVTGVPGPQVSASSGLIGPSPAAAAVCAVARGLQLPVNVPLRGGVAVTNAAGLSSGLAPFTVTVQPPPPGPFSAWAHVFNGNVTRGITQPALAEQILVRSADAVLNVLLTLPVTTVYPVTQYWVSVGRAGDDEYTPDLLAWRPLFVNTSMVANATVTVNTPSGRVTALNATVAVPFPGDVRAKVAVAAFTGSPGLWRQGLAALADAAAVAITPQVFVWDRSPPTFDAPSVYWPSTTPVVVRSADVAQPPPLVAASGITVPEVYSAARSDIVIDWAPLREVHSTLASVTLFVDVANSNVTGENPVAQPSTVSRAIVVPRTVVLNPASNTSVSLRMAIPPGRGQYRANWVDDTRTGLDFPSSRVPSIFWPDGLRTSDGLAGCKATCASAPDCVAYTFNTAASPSSANCFPWKYHENFVAASTTGLVIASRALSQSVFRVNMEVNNSVGASTVYTQDFVLDAVAPSFPSPGINVLADTVCSAPSVDLALQALRAVEWSPDTLTGLGNLCVGFVPASGAGANQVIAYTLAVGTRVGGDDLLPFTRVSTANAMVSSDGIPSNDGYVKANTRTAVANRVIRLRTPQFRATRSGSIFVTIRAYSSAGVVGEASSYALTLLNSRNLRVGFSTWPSVDRTVVDLLDPGASLPSRIPLSWTGPGGDAAKPLWGGSSPDSPVPGGVARFEIGLSTTPDEAGLLSAPGWINAGLSQQFNLTAPFAASYASSSPSVLNACSKVSTGARAGYMGWSFDPTPSAHTLLMPNTNNYRAAITVADEAACCEQCGLFSRNTPCTAWTFLMTSAGAGNCFLYAGAMVARQARGAVSGTMGLNVQPFASGRSVHDGISAKAVGFGPASSASTDRPVADPAYPNGLRVTSLEDCGRRCSQNSTCMFYLFQPLVASPAPNCFPYVSLGVMEPVDTPGTVLGVASGAAASTCSRSFTGYYTLNNVVGDRTVAAPSPQQCCAECRKVSCGAWQWRETTGTPGCRLVTSFGALAAAATTAGSPIYTIGVPSAWSTVTTVPALKALFEQPKCVGRALPGVVPDAWPGITYAVGDGAVAADPVKITPAGTAAADQTECCTTCSGHPSCVLATYDPDQPASSRCTLYSSFQRLKPADSGSYIVTMLPKVVSSGPAYGLVSVVTGANARATVATRPFYVDIARRTIPGIVTQAAVSDVTTGLTLNCSWSPFTDPAGFDVSYDVNVQIKATNQDKMLYATWIPVQGNNRTSIRIPMATLQDKLVEGVRCAVRGSNAAVNGQWTVSDDDYITVDTLPVTQGIVTMQAYDKAGGLPKGGPFAQADVDKLDFGAVNQRYASISAGTSMRIIWKGFGCQKSKLSTFRVCVGEFRGDCDIADSGPLKAVSTDAMGTATTLNQVVVYANRSASSGATVFATVYATCTSGMVGQQSNGPTANDMSPPAPTGEVRIVRNGYDQGGPPQWAVSNMVTANKANVNRKPFPAGATAGWALDRIRSDADNVNCAWAPTWDTETGGNVWWPNLWLLTMYDTKTDAWVSNIKYRIGLHYGLNDPPVAEGTIDEGDVFKSTFKIGNTKYTDNYCLRTQPLYYVFSGSGLSADGGATKARLAQGPVYCSVVAINTLGLESVRVFSPPVYADWTAPAWLDFFGEVFDGPDAGVDVEASMEPASQLSLSWAGATDVGSGIDHFDACISTNPQEVKDRQTCNVVPWTVTKGFVQHTFTGLRLVNKTTYYTCVRIVDQAGLMSSAICSDGVMVDGVAPQISPAVAADLELESMAQNASAGMYGWRYAHLFSSTAMLPDTGVLNASLSLKNVSTTTLKRVADLQKALLTAGPAGPRPRLTVGLDPLKVEGGVEGSATCRLSTRIADVPMFLPGQPKFNDTRPTALLTVNFTSVTATVGCKAGSSYSPVLDSCIPCADGFYDAQDGLNACKACPANTRAAALANVAQVTDVSQQTRRYSSGGGPSACDCWDDSQVFLEDVGCVCRAGYVANAAWQAPYAPQRKFSEGRLVPANYPAMCVPMTPSNDGRAFKPVPGDSAALVRSCPVGAMATADFTSCICPTAGQLFDASSNSCLCGPNAFLASRYNATSRVNITTCDQCAAGTIKAGPGNNKTACLPCPTGTRALVGLRGCEVDPDYLAGEEVQVPIVANVNTSGTLVPTVIGQRTDFQGAMLMPDGTGVACAPGYALDIGCGTNADRGWEFEITKVALFSGAPQGRKTCMAITRPWLTGPDRAPVVSGRALYAGLEVAVEDSFWARQEIIGGIFSQSTLYYDYLDLRPLISFPGGTYRVRVNGRCTLPDTFCTAKCKRCGSGSFQPYVLPVGTDLVKANQVYGGSNRGKVGGIGQCAKCPDLLSGSYYAGTDRALQADWSGVFVERESGIDHYEVALGSVVGGTQVQAYTTVPASVTNMTLAAAGVVTGTPIFLSVVAVDKAGNRAVLEDTRPVLVDDTSPLPGLVLDLDVNSVLANRTAAAYLQAIGAFGAASSSGVVAVTDVASKASDSTGSLAGQVSRQVLTVSDLLSNITDRNSTAASTSRQALSEALIKVVVPNSTLRSKDWRSDPTFYSLYGFPDADFSPLTNTYAMTWEPFLDVGSGVKALGYCIGTRPYACDTVPLTRLPTAKLTVDTLTVTGLALPAGTMVYATVIAVNGVGLVSMGTSNGLVPDDRYPVPGRVYDTGSYFEEPLRRVGDISPAAPVAVDIDCDIQGSGIGAAWEGFVSLAGMDHYEWAVGTSPNGTDLRPWTDVGYAGSAWDSTIRAPVGSVVYASVKAVGRNGKATYISSDGVRILGDEVDAAGSDVSGTIMLNATTGALYTVMDESPVPAADRADLMFLCRVPSTRAVQPGQGVAAGDAVIIGLP